jgi:hypothetical protein
LEQTICVRFRRCGNSLSRWNEAGKKFCRAACVEDSFLSWLENRTVVLTFFLHDEAEASAPTEEQGSSVVGSNDKDGSKKIRRVMPLSCASAAAFVHDTPKNL